MKLTGNNNLSKEATHALAQLKESADSDEERVETSDLFPESVIPDLIAELREHDTERVNSLVEGGKKMVR